MKAIVFGASGYAGAELVRILSGHPALELVGVSAAGNAGRALADVYPHFAGRAEGRMVLKENSDLLAEVGLLEPDVAFLALPHNAAAHMAPQLLQAGVLVVDLSADFRLKNPSQYESAYGFTHPHPELLEEAVYGLPELNRSELMRARLIASPGCYVTAATLALFPMVERGLVLSGSAPIVDAASGASGAGRGAKVANLFGEIDSDVQAYGLHGHRHRPEIEQNVGCAVLFVPHLVPMTRGILASCYFDLEPTAHTFGPEPSRLLVEELLTSTLEDFYGRDEFVVILEPGTSPRTKATLGTNSAHIAASFDPATNKVVVLCAIDNMVKGAAGQAVQAANLALGLDEDLGLAKVSVYP